jgi:hypothetical protein
MQTGGSGGQNRAYPTSLPSSRSWNSSKKRCRASSRSHPNGPRRWRAGSMPTRRCADGRNYRDILKVQVQNLDKQLDEMTASIEQLLQERMAAAFCIELGPWLREAVCCRL